MKTVRSMTGMPVVCGGRRVGRVSGVRLDGALTRLEGIWMDCGLRGDRFIDRGLVDILGDVAILAANDGKRCKRERAVAIRRALSTGGDRLGAITDAIIDEETLLVRSLELSLGFFDDLLTGRRTVSGYTVRPDGDVVVESAQANEEGRLEEWEREN